MWKSGKLKTEGGTKRGVCIIKCCTPESGPTVMIRGSAIEVTTSTPTRRVRTAALQILAKN